MISFQIFIEGRFAYHGLFACSVDAVVDAIDRGARKVKVVPA